MNYTYEIEINAPLEKVVKLAGDPANRMSWMDGIESYEPVSGTPGEVGSKSKMVFKTGNMKMTMVGTVVANNLPQSFTESIDASNLTSTAISKFVAAGVDKTKYISEQNFVFKGLLNKIVGFLLQGEFKKQTLRHMEGFKRFAEQQK
jgi:carbon monoxide dehydrogenase subunit G